MNPYLLRYLQILALAIIGVAIILGVGSLGGATPVHALPEYSTRTSEACGACHVNAGGGGPRTLRGLLWAAQGRPDAVSILKNVLIAPGVEDGMELYDIACSGCHGASGEGLFGKAIIGSGLAENKISSTIERGRERSGMPAYEGQFTDDQLDSLVAYVTGLASGQIEPPPASYPLEAALFGCAENSETDPCGGN